MIAADKKIMRKRVAIILWLLVVFSMVYILPLTAINLPELSFKYEILQGIDEDEDSGELLPDSIKHSFLFSIREDFSRSFRNTLKSRYVVKDYLASSGSYSYIKLYDSTSWSVTDMLKCNLDFGGKRIFFDNLDSEGLSKDYYLFSGKLGVGYRLNEYVKLGSWIKSSSYMYLNSEKSKEEWSLSGEISSTIDNFRLSARYRGTLRLPLGSDSDIGMNVFNYGSFSVKWKE